MPKHQAVDVAEARRRLEDARQNLDEAVSVIPGFEDEDVLATPALLALLLDVVTAKRHLDGLERDAKQTRTFLRPV